MDKTKLLGLRERLLEQIAAINSMQRGKITTTSPRRKRKDGSSYTAGPYHKMQRWEQGANQTRYLTAEEYAELKPDIDNYHEFRSLCDQLAEVTEALTLAGTPPTKKKRRSTGRSSRPATPKSKSSSGSPRSPSGKAAPSTSSNSKRGSKPR